ncbi:MAG: NADH-quinone oxidoreductase subunit NuoE [Clostridia bacterium]|nr:NADH-quinone oxidoreductase subunit NuoE [Clostridia bacterium]
MCQCNCKKTDLSLMDGVLEKYKNVSGSLITILQKVQEIYGYLPVDAIYHIAGETGSTPAKVMGVATFYTQFRLKPVGKYLIMLCQGTACHVNGSERIEAAIAEELGIHDGETTEDGLFTLKNVACLGCCSLSPVMMINDETYGSLTPDKTVTILRELRKKAQEDSEK